MSELSNGRSDRTLVWYLWMALAIAVHVALLDMVVETFISGAAARWWLVLAALAYAALLGYAFRAKKLPALLEPRAATIVGTLVGLGLILLTVAVPGGFDRGVAAFGAQTTAVLHAISALGVAVAGAALILERRRPMAIPVLIGALAAYATLSFVVAIAAGDPYVALFRGESFWRALPWWLQGAPVGALLLAAAVLVGIGAALFRIPRYRLSTAVTATALAITLGVPTTALLRAQQLPSPVTAGGPGGGGDAEGPIEQDGTQRGPDVSLDAPQRQAGETSDSNETDSGATDDAVWSEEWPALRDKLAATGPAIRDFASIVAEVGRDPNDLAMYVQSQLRHDAYAGILRGPEGALRIGGGNDADKALVLAELLRVAGYDVRFASARVPNDLSTSAAPPPADQSYPNALVDELMANVALHFVEIGDALFDAGFLKDPSEVPLATYVDEGRAHVWVQYREGGAEWRNLGAVAELAEDPTVLSATSVGSDPDAPSHNVAVTLRAVVRREGTDYPVQLLSLSAPAYALAFEPMTLYFEPEAESTIPYLSTPSAQIRGEPLPVTISTTGSLTTVRNKLQGALDIFESLPDSEPGNDPASSPDQLVDLWIEIKTTLGDLPQATESYPMLVKGDPAPAGAVVSAAGDQALANALSSVYSIAVATGAPPADAVHLILSRAQPPSEPLGVGAFLSVLGLQYEMLRATMPVSVLGVDTRRVITSPAVVIARADPGLDGTASISLSVVLKGYELSTSAGEADFVDKLANGILDHAVERLLLGSSPTSVGSFFELAYENEIPLVAVAGDDADLPLYLSGRATRAVRDTLSRGNVVVLPAQPSASWQQPVGWWEISAAGYVRDTDELGFHPTQTETAVELRERASWAERYRNFACALAIVLGSASQQVGEVMTAVGDPSGVAFEAGGKLVTSIGEFCERKPPVAPRARMPLPQGRTPGTGFPAIFREMSRRPWSYGGRVFFPGR